MSGVIFCKGMLFWLALGAACVIARPLNVYVLAGQSNMAGMALSEKVSDAGDQLNGTLLYQLSDQRTALQFAPLWNKATNDWAVLDDVKIWFNQASRSTQGNDGSDIPGVAGVSASFGSLGGVRAVGHWGSRRRPQTAE